MRRVGVLAATSVLCLSSLAAAGPAQAVPCYGYGGVDPEPKAYNRWTVYENTIYSNWFWGEVNLGLRVGTLNNQQVAWARLTGPAQKSNDAVWLDVSEDGGRNWVQCGLVWNGDGSRNLWTIAIPTRSDPNFRFRACGQAARGGGIRCGSWW